jgi:hypothetical protein
MYLVEFKLEKMKYRRRALHKAALGFFQFLEIVTGWLVPSAVKGPA